MVLGHHHLPQHHGLAPAGLGHVAAHRRLAHVGAVLVDQALPDPPGRVALLLGTSASATSQPSIVAFHGSSTGDTRGGVLRGGGTDDARAWRTVRRCTLNFLASARTDSSWRSRVLRICSNNSTFDLVVMDHTVEPAIPPVVDPRPHEVPPGWGQIR